MRQSARPSPVLLRAFDNGGGTLIGTTSSYGAAELVLASRPP
jgi:hypothetical protein